MKNFAVIDLSVSADKTVDVAEPVIISVTEDITPDPDMEKYVHDALEPLRDPRLDVALATCTTMLDGRFISIRTQETGLGNLVVDSSKLIHQLFQIYAYQDCYAITLRNAYGYVT